MRPTRRIAASASEARGRLDSACRVEAGPLDRSAIGWATVELDRAERELADAFGTGIGAFGAAPDDRILGARCRSPRAAPPGSDSLVLEPTTEGRLAATLARHGEGPAVVWFALDAADATGAGTSTAGRSARSAPSALVARAPVDGRTVLLRRGPSRVPSRHDRPADRRSAVTLRPADAGRRRAIASLFTDEGYPAGPSDIVARLERFALAALPVSSSPSTTARSSASSPSTPCPDSSTTTGSCGSSRSSSTPAPASAASGGR